jgi:ABC-type branched-subunit amino acid transport system substrate-binding protein
MVRECGSHKEGGNERKGGKTMKMKGIVLFMACVCLLWVGCGVSFAADKEPIPVGIIASLTGYLSEQARHLVEAQDLAVEEINSKGGVLGRPLKSFLRDDEMKPNVGARKFEELVENQKIVMEAGIVTGAVAAAVAQANRKYGILFITHSGSNTTQGPKQMLPTWFITGCTLEAFGLAGGEYATSYLGKKGFLLYPDYVHGWDIRDGFLKSIPANGGEIVGTIAVPTTTTDFTPFLTQILAKNPDYVVLQVNGMMFINCMKQAYAMGMKGKMKFLSTHANIEEINACGPEVVKDVIFVTDYFWNLPNEKNRIFVDKFMKKYGNDRRPSMRHYYQWTALHMWAEVVKKVGTVEPKKVAAGYLGYKGETANGPNEIRTTGDHTAIQPVVVARGKGPKEMKDKFDTQEIVKLYTGEKYFDSPKEKGW